MVSSSLLSRQMIALTSHTAGGKGGSEGGERQNEGGRGREGGAGREGRYFGMQLYRAYMCM